MEKIQKTSELYSLSKKVYREPLLSLGKYIVWNEEASGMAYDFLVQEEVVPEELKFKEFYAISRGSSPPQAFIEKRTKTLIPVIGEDEVSPSFVSWAKKSLRKKKGEAMSVNFDNFDFVEEEKPKEEKGSSLLEMAGIINEGSTNKLSVIKGTIQKDVFRKLTSNNYDLSVLTPDFYKSMSARLGMKVMSEKDYKASPKKGFVVDASKVQGYKDIQSVEVEFKNGD